jgi:hypothetical protein
MELPRGRPRLAFSFFGLMRGPGALPYTIIYDAIVFLFDVGEESRVAQV